MYIQVLGTWQVKQPKKKKKRFHQELFNLLFFSEKKKDLGFDFPDDGFETEATIDDIIVESIPPFKEDSHEGYFF